MLQGLAMGDDEDAPETFLRLARELERTHGALAPLTLEAWEGVAENSDRRGDLDDPAHWRRGIAIRSMLADRYAQIVENAVVGVGFASGEAFDAMDKMIEYLHLSERGAEIAGRAGDFYHGVCAEAGSLSAEARSARRFLPETPADSATSPAAVAGAVAARPPRFIDVAKRRPALPSESRQVEPSLPAGGQDGTSRHE